MTTVTLPDLTTGVIDGPGVFDKLMATNKAHLEAEFAKGRITGPDYSTVYLGLVQATLTAGMAFLAQQQRIGLEADLLVKQIALLDKQIIHQEKQTLLTEQQTLLTKEQTANAVLEGKVLIAQECKLRAEYNLTVATITKVGKETDLLAQKVITEKAQVLELGVDDNSVIGRQKALYAAQTKGFSDDANLKAAKLLVDTWNARRMTDEGTIADGVNMLNDATIGRAVNHVLTGINA